MKKPENRVTVPAKVLEVTVPAMEELEEILSKIYPKGNYSKGDCINYAVIQTLDSLKKEAVSEYSLELKGAKDALEIFLEKALKAERTQKSREIEISSENKSFKAEIDRMKVLMHDMQLVADEKFEEQVRVNEKLTKEKDKLVEQNRVLADLTSRQNVDVNKVGVLEKDIQKIRHDLEESLSIIEKQRFELTNADSKLTRVTEQNKTHLVEIATLKEECMREKEQKIAIEIQKANLEGKLEVLNNQLMDYRKEKENFKQVAN